MKLALYILSIILVVFLLYVWLGAPSKEDGGASQPLYRESVEANCQNHEECNSYCEDKGPVLGKGGYCTEQGKCICVYE